MTHIYARVQDQILTATIAPRLACNNRNTVKLHVEFDDSWDAISGRSAVFTTSVDPTPYEIVLSDGVCTVPHEVLTYEGHLFISIIGVNPSADLIKSTMPIMYKVLPGTPAMIVSTPTADVYHQLLTHLAIMQARLNNAESAVTVDSEVQGIRVGADGKTYSTAGEAVREQAKSINATITQAQTPLANRQIVYSGCVANNLINKSRVTKGYYVDTHGKLTDGADWCVSEKIDITGISTLYFSGGVGLTCFYDANNTFISYVQNGATVAVPNGAKYLIASVLLSYLPTAMICKHKNQMYDDGFISLARKGYESGFIPFTVSINQSVADNSVDVGVSSEGAETRVDVDCVLSLPVTYSAAGLPCKLLMMCHGAGKGVTEWKENDGYKAIVQKFVDRGYAVFDCNGFKNDALGWSFWGNPRGVNAWRKAYQYVVNNYNVEREFSIYAFSMGGLTAMNLALQGFPNIKSIALGSPVLNLKACWNDSSVRAVLQQLYGLGELWDETKVVGCDPYKSIVELDEKKYCFKTLPPVKVWYGSTETSHGVNKQYAIEFVEAITNSGGYAEYREINGAGHEISYGMNEYCNIDYLLFTERFNLPNNRE